MERRGGVADRDRVARAVQLRECLLETRNGRPLGQVIGTQHVRDRGDVLLADRLSAIGDHVHAWAGITCSSINARICSLVRKSTLLPLL